MKICSGNQALNIENSYKSLLIAKLHTERKYEGEVFRFSSRGGGGGGLVETG